MGIRTVITAVYLIVTSGAALAATEKQINGCTMAELYSDRVAACSEILQNKSENKQMRSLVLGARGAALRYMGELELALSDLNNALDLSPENHMAYDTRAFLWRDKGELDRAISDFSDAIKFNPSMAAHSGRATSFSHRGVTWQLKGDREHALADFNESIRLDGQFADYYDRRARLFAELPNLALALDDLKTAVQLNPAHVDALYLRGAIRYEQYISASEWVRQDDLDDALKDFTEVIRLLPTASRAYYFRGLARKLNGDKYGMITDLIESYKIDPNDKQVVAWLEQVQPDYRAIAEPLTKLMDWTDMPRNKAN